MGRRFVVLLCWGWIGYMCFLVIPHLPPRLAAVLIDRSTDPDGGFTHGVFFVLAWIWRIALLSSPALFVLKLCHQWKKDTAAEARQNESVVNVLREGSDFR